MSSRSCFLSTQPGIFVIPAFVFCHPGLEPGSRAHSRPLQTALAHTGSRVFARDDQDEDSTDARTSSGLINMALINMALINKALINKASFSG